MSADADRKTVAAESEAAPAESGSSRFPPPQLRLHDRQVYVGFGETPLAEGLRLADLALIVPEVSFPFDIAGGAATRYQKKKCRFGYLDLQLDHALIHAAARRIQEGCSEHVAELRLHLRAQLMEGEGKLHAPGKPAPFTFRIGFQPEGSSVIACVHDVRLYGPAPLPAAFLAALLARAAARAGAVPESKPWGAVGLAFDPVPSLLRRAVPLRGFRLPQMDDARLARVEPGPNAFHLHFSANARAELSIDEDLLTCIEGSRSFSQGEALLARGELSAAEAYYLRHGESPSSHPFAQERLLTLLAARPDAHDLALDLAAGLRRARAGSAASYWAEATIRLARGERRKAGELFLELGEIARSRDEEAAAFQAFAAAGRALSEPSPAAASRAFQDALVFRPDDFDSLLSLATAADRASDHEGAMRAYRRIGALARDPAQAARAHVRLGQLLLKLSDDRAAARLHFDAALRLAPDDPEALVQLSGLCTLDGEHLRALRLLDQLRAAATRAEDRPLEARACLLSGGIWEQGLGHLSNALLRYQEAVELAPNSCEAHLSLAALHERQGRHPEALESYRQVVVLAEGRLDGPDGAGFRAAAHRAHHALARLSLERLGDQAAALASYEAALALVPDDLVAMRALIPSFRQSGREAELAAALERCASSAPEARERAAMLAEAGELLAGPLGDATHAQRLLEQALLIEPGNQRALGALADLAEAAGEGPALCRHLLRLVELSEPGAGRAALLHRLARAARDVAGDLDLAADALGRALAIDPDDLAARAELCAVQRRRGDEAGLAEALAGWAQALERDGEPAEAARALRELARLGATRLGQSEQALAHLERALLLAPEDPETLLDLGDLSLSVGRASSAREAFSSLLAALPASAPAERVLDLKARLGRACDALGMREAAIEAFATVFASRPGDDAIADRLDALLAESGRTRERAAALLARAKAKREAGLSAAAAASFRTAGELFASGDEGRSARAAFEACLDADPDGPCAPAALDALSQTALAEHDEPRASDLLARRAAFEGDPRAAARLLFRAASLARRGRPARAQALLAAAAGRDPLFPPARAALAELRLADDDHAQALAHAEIALGAGADPDAIDPAAALALRALAAKAARALGDAASARQHLAVYCEQRPDDLEALVQLAALMREAGEIEPLASLLGKLVRMLPNERAAEAARERATLLHELGKREDSIASWHDALALLPDDPQALEGLAGALDEADEAPERAQALGRLAALSRDPERRQRLLFDQGEALLLAARPSEAVEAFAKASRCGQPSPQALERLAEAARRAGDAPREIDALGRRAELAASEGEPDAAERLLQLGHRLMELGEPDLALRALERVEEHAPSDHARRDALHALIELREARGEREAAAERLGQLAACLKGSERAAALVRRAEHLKSLDDREGARDALREALTASPGDRRAILLLKTACAELKDEPGYIQALEALLALPQRDRAAAAALAFELGELLLRKHDEPERAEAALRRALSYDHDHFDAARALFELLVDREAFGEALPLGERLALRVADPRKSAQWLLALSRLALRKRSDPSAALRMARLAFERDGSDPAVASRLAELLYLMGSVDEALPLYRRLAATADLELDRERAEQLLLRHAELSLWSGDRARAIGSLRQLLEACPTCAPAAEALYEALLPQDPAAAINVLARHASSLAPGGRPLRLLMRLAEEARSRLGAPALAAELLERARPSADDPLPLERARAEALREAGDKAGLASALRAIASLALEHDAVPEARASLDELGELLLSVGNAAGAAAALAKAADLCLEQTDTDGAAARLRRRGEVLRDRLSDPAGAESAFRRAFLLDPADLASARAAADLCATRGDASGEAELVEALAPLLQSSSERAAALVRLGRLQLGLGDSARASAALESALRLEPGLAAARDLLDELLALEGRFSDLAASCEARAATLATPAERIALLRRAASIHRTQAGDPKAAARALLAARAVAPDDPPLAEECAQALVEAGQADEAAALDAEILARDPGNGPAFERRLAHLRTLGDDEGRALLLEVRASREQPKQAAALLLDAAALREQLGHLSDAEADEQRAFDLDPTNGRAFALLIGRRGSRGPEPLAELLLKRARAVPEEALGLHRTRAQVLCDAGRLDAAREALDEALALAPEDLEALAMRADLEESLGGDAAASPFDQRVLALSEHGALVPRSQLVRCHYRAGLSAFAREDYETASKLLGAGYALDPAHDRSGPALEALALCFARSGDREQLYRVSMALAERAGEKAERAAALRQALGAAADLSSELKALEQLADLERADADLQERLADALAFAGRFDDQLAALVRAAEAPTEPANRARLLLEAASVAQRQLVDSKRARALRAEARKADPQSLEALRATLEDLREAGDAPALAEALAALADRVPDSAEAAEARLERARALDAAGLPAAADAWHEIVLGGSSAPGFEEACDRARPLLEAAGRFREAAGVLAARAEAGSPALAPGLLGEAATILESKVDDLDGALALQNRAAELAPEDPAPHAARARLFERQGRLAEQASALLEESRRLASGADRSERLLAAARILDGLGRHQESLARLREAATACPESLEARLKLAERCEAMGLAEEALEQLRIASGIATGPEREALQRRAARAALVLGQTEVARPLLEALLARHPDDVEAFDSLRAELARSGAHAELLALLERREQLLRTSDERHALPDLLREQAELRARLGDPARAEALYREALGLAPEARQLFAPLKALVAARDDAFSLCELLEAESRVVESADERSQLLEEVATLASGRLGDPRRAAAALDRARAEASDPARAERLGFDLASARLRAGEPASALETARSLTTDEPRRRALAAEALEALGDRAGARAEVLTLLEARPDDEALFAQLERLEAGEAPAELARALTLRAQASQGASRADLRSRQARAWRAAGDPAREREALEALLEENPGCREGFDRLCALLREQGALAALRQRLESFAAVEPAPADASPLWLQSAEICRASLSDLEGAAHAFAEGLRADPRSTRAAEGLAEALGTLGQTDLGSLERRLPEPCRGTVALLLGERSERAEEPRRALELFGRAALDPALATRGLQGMLRAAERLEDHPRSLEACERLLARAGTDGVQAGALHAKAAEHLELLGRRDEAIGHLQAAAVHGAASPEALSRLADWYLERKQWPEAAATLTWVAEQAVEENERLRASKSASHLYSEQIGDFAQATSVLERALERFPEDHELLVALCKLGERAGKPRVLVETAERLERACGSAPLMPFLPALGRALCQLGREPEALRRLRQALEHGPDEELSSEARALADRLGDLDAFAEIELKSVDTLASRSPAEAAERLRTLADRLEQDDPLRAASLLERAYGLDPKPLDLEQQAELFERDPATATRALHPLTLLARAAPLSPEPRQRLAAAAELAGQTGRARLLRSVDGFFERRREPATGALRTIDSALRERLYEPLALGPTARLIAAAAPALGAVLGGEADACGLREQDRIVPGRAPALYARLKAALRATGLPRLDLWLTTEPGVRLEPGAPDRLRFGLGALASVDGAALGSALVRACELSRMGFAAADLAGAHGLPDLVRLTAAAAGCQTEVAAPFASRIPAMAEALRTIGGEPLEPLATEALAESATLDPKAFLKAVELSATRVSLLACGDAAAAMRASLLISPRLAEADLEALDLQEIAGRVTELSDELLTCLREDLGKLLTESE